MQRLNQSNPSQAKNIQIDVSDDTVAFMLSNGFSTEGNWFKWYTSRSHPRPVNKL